LAERDLVRDGFAFFALAWVAAGSIWKFALASGAHPLLTWSAALATTAGEIAVLAAAARWISRTVSPLLVRAQAFVAMLAIVSLWTVAASSTDAPLSVLVPLFAVLALVPPLFFGWSWRGELALMVAIGAQASLWLRVLEPTSGVAVVDLLVVFGSTMVLGAAVAARLTPEFHARILRREEGEESRRALAESREARLESEERFRVAFHRAPIGMSMVDVDGVIQQVNRAFEHMLGRTADELVGQPMDAFIQDDDLATARSDRLQVLSGDVEMLDSLMRLRHRDGNVVLARVTRALVRDRDGKPSHMIGQVEDVTERHRAEEALQTSERTFRSFAESMAAGVLIVQHGVLRYANAAVTVITGFSGEEILGQSILFLVDPADRDQVSQRGMARMHGDTVPTRAEYRAHTKSGEERWVDITVVLIDYEGAPAMLGTAFDVTERKRAEQALATSERMFRGFTESTAAGVFIVQDEVIRYTNAAVTTITGFPADELRGMPLGTLLHPDDRALALARARARVRDEPVPVRVEYRFLRKLGGYCWIDLTVGIVEHEGRSALLATAFDITERRIAEEALRTSLEELQQREEQLRLLAQRQVKVREEERRRLGFDLHDDVCQELVGTGIMVESVRGRVQAIDPESSQKLARVGRHLNELGEHLRLVARELRPMLLHDLGLEDSVRSLTAGMSGETRITTRVPTPIPRLSEDVEVAVYRIVQEAITNALRHANANEIDVTLATAEGVLTVEIRDDGHGFDVKARQRDALGLVSMEERALALGGKLQVISAPARGTAVVLTCPLIRRVPRPAA
ncbi:MAG: PAS domain S-box protein, partial [Candidatus Binatia bacterium]